MLWEVDIYPAPGEPDRASAEVASAATELNLGVSSRIVAGHGFLIQGPLDQAQLERIARELLVDSTVERAVVAPLGDSKLVNPAALPSQRHNGATTSGQATWRAVHVLPKPGVMDPVAASTLAAIADLGLQVD